MRKNDDTVGTLLKALDDMDIANDTLMAYTSDNSLHMNTLPNAAMTRSRSEKNTTWEGAFRVPMLIRWPGQIKPGTVTNEVVNHDDCIPTFCAIAGEPDTSTSASRVHRLQRQDVQSASRRLRPKQVPHDGRRNCRKNNGVKSTRKQFFCSDDDGLLVGCATAT